MSDIIRSKEDLQAAIPFPVGPINAAHIQYFSGECFLAPISGEMIGINNVTFEPGCHNHWHVHKASKNGGQMLICLAGRGWYQEWGGEPRELHPGDVVHVAPGVKHWHGAAKDSWFSHLAVAVPGEDAGSQWLEAVDDAVYDALP